MKRLEYTIGAKSVNEIFPRFLIPHRFRIYMDEHLEDNICQALKNSKVQSRLNTPTVVMSIREPS